MHEQHVTVQSLPDIWGVLLYGHTLRPAVVGMNEGTLYTQVPYTARWTLLAAVAWQFAILLAPCQWLF